MEFRGVVRNPKAVGYLFVSKPIGQHPQYLQFPSRKCFSDFVFDLPLAVLPDESFCLAVCQDHEVL
jgi:hypothetical protein